MKLSPKFLTAALAAMVTFTPAILMADINEIAPVPDPAAGKEPEKIPGNVLRASDLIGMKVERAGKKEAVGKVEDVVVGLDKGRIIAVLIALKDGETIRAVPPRALHYDLLGQVIHLKPTLEKVQSAPVIERPTWQVAMKPEKLAALYKHFDEEPFFAVPEKDSKEGPVSLGPMEMATKLGGGPVVNGKKENIGTVNNCMVDLSTGHIPFVVVDTGTYLGKSGTLSPVPSEALSYDTKLESLVLDVTKNSLAQLPHFTTREWPDMNKGIFIDTVYAAYGIKPQSATTPAPAGEKLTRNTPETTEKAVDPQKSKQDAEITADIKKEIISRKDISAEAKTVKVVTKEGKVTLLGKVKTEEEKRVINELAVESTDRDRVDNQLEVK